MKAAKRLAALALLARLAFLTSSLGATPTRAMTLDNQQELVADDYDATVYYSLAPHFNNHLYLEALSGTAVVGWTFLDIKYGTLILWWNRPYAPASLFNTLGSNTAAGYSLGGLSSGQAPQEDKVMAPDMKVAVGYALETSITGLNLGVCFQYAELDQELDSASSDGSGGALLTALPSQAHYLSGSYSYASDNLKVSSYKNSQTSSGMTLAPLLSYANEIFALDAKLELIWNHIDNTHSEVVGATNMAGSVTQELKDVGSMSRGGNARIRFPIQNGSIVLKGSYYSYAFSTQHSEDGSFSGSGFASNELAGFNQVDATEDLTQKAWDAMLGWVHGFGNGHGLIVIGAGVNGSTTEIDDFSYAPRAAGSTNYNDLVSSGANQNVAEGLFVPVLIGSEVELGRGVTLRGVLQRNFYGKSTVKNTAQSFDPSSGDLASSVTDENDSDLNPQYVFATGLGMDFGSVHWDTALNTSFLASSGGWVNPAYQSTLSFSF